MIKALVTLRHFVTPPLGGEDRADDCTIVVSITKYQCLPQRLLPLSGGDTEGVTRVTY